MECFMQREEEEEAKRRENSYNKLHAAKAEKELKQIRLLHKRANEMGCKPRAGWLSSQDVSIFKTRWRVEEWKKSSFASCRGEKKN